VALLIGKISLVFKPRQFLNSALDFKGIQTMVLSSCPSVQEGDAIHGCKKQVPSVLALSIHHFFD
jgi:hypothetical protein